MFAPKIAKPQAKATESPVNKPVSQHSTLLGRRLAPDPANRATFLQRTIGNQATLRLLSQRTGSLTGSGASGLEVGQKNMPLNSLQREATVELQGYGTNWVGLTGYASTKGKARFNREMIARPRVEEVKRALIDFGVSAKAIEDSAPGEYDYLEEDPKKEVPDENNRRVHIEVDEAPVKIADPEPGFE